jgi:hypothetical protein
VLLGVAVLHRWHGCLYDQHGEVSRLSPGSEFELDVRRAVQCLSVQCLQGSGVV